MSLQDNSNRIKELLEEVNKLQTASREAALAQIKDLMTSYNIGADEINRKPRSVYLNTGKIRQYLSENPTTTKDAFNDWCADNAIPPVNASNQWKLWEKKNVS